jgi:chemotaxis protein CheC
VIDVPGVCPVRLDVLRELVNIGSGHAVSALAQLTGLGIMMEVPSVGLLPLEEARGTFAPPHRRTVGVAARVLGDVTGRALFSLQEEDADLLGAALQHRYQSPGDPLAGLQQSAVLEAGNILIGTFLSATARCVGKRFLPSVPTVVSNRDVRRFAGVEGTGGSQVLLAETVFLLDDAEVPLPALRGALLLLLDEDSALHDLASGSWRDAWVPTSL